MEWILWNGSAVEEVARVEGAVAEEFNCRAMELIRSRLRNDVYDGARISTKLRVGPCDDRYLGERIEGQKGARGSPDAWFIDGRAIVVTVIHIGAVEKIVVRFTPAAVDAECAE